ncbi:MAG TPA: BPSS1780 family membrane protein [Usitatibacteraceae bacterium]|nr:BPSS1780 family membrane protein [Usitatibacteraceae bacterium]
MNANEPGTALPGSASNDPGPATLVMPARVVRAGAGVDWISDGWALFRKAPLMWIIFLVLFFLVHVGLGMVPWIGTLIGTIISPILMGGMALGCRSLETGGDLELEHLLAGFRRNTGPLVAVGLLYLVGELVLLSVFAMFAGMGLLTAVLSGDEAAILSSLSSGLLFLALGGLVTLALAIPLVAAYWFAPVLAMLHDVPAIPAMKESLFACLRNWLPMLVYGLVMLLLLVVAVIPLGLGLLVWAPLMFATIYTSYRSVFTEAD